MAKQTVKTPKYEIRAMRKGMKLPAFCDWCDVKKDLIIKCSTLAVTHGDCDIIVLLIKGFTHRKPFKWRYHNTNETLEATAVFDRTQGTGVFEEMPGADERLKKSRNLAVSA